MKIITSTKIFYDELVRNWMRINKHDDIVNIKIDILEAYYIILIKDILIEYNN